MNEFRTISRSDGSTVSINLANVTHLTACDAKNTNVHLVGGTVIKVAGSVHQMTAFMNNPKAVAA